VADQQRAYYFGCWQRSGHYFFLPGMKSPWRERRETPEEIVPWGFDVDSRLAPLADGSTKEKGRYRYSAGEAPNGVALLHHRDGWTALSFWDNSVDSRGNSSSTFIFEDTLDFDEALVRARELFPQVFERFDFEVRQMEGPARVS
jgi:hypothetical protein